MKEVIERLFYITYKLVLIVGMVISITILSMSHGFNTALIAAFLLTGCLLSILVDLRDDIINKLKP